MFTPIEMIAEFMEVSECSIHRWVNDAGLVKKTRKGGKALVPFRALLNYMVETDRLPLKYIERDCFTDTERGRFDSVQSVLKNLEK